MKQTESNRIETKTNENNDDNNTFYLADFHSWDSVLLRRKPENRTFEYKPDHAQTPC